MHAEIEARLKAAKTQLQGGRHGLSPGKAFVRGRMAGAKRGKALAIGIDAACGAALVAITALLWLQPGHASDSALAASLVADALWIAGWLLRR